ncbi:TonB-dependent receptor plug domain-containing protein [Azoarcus indigens]|uniref:Iron complex outermembrane receptor protein n=1 Tax=Azoarcus indigens TaxID=29545 RepID=A0A4R6E3N6_9RHOO|nr:TonB-dependent receptor [Azoarcus indigens]TDN52427.1 iron complex outermembrane receptor protein [Azoarcus indigens]
MALGDAPEDAYLGDLPVVLSASRLAQPTREAPGAITVIDRDMIRASGARSVAELLRWVPGFQVGEANAFRPLTAYHGLADDNPRRMLVRVDGRSLYSPYFLSGVEWHKLTVDIDDIERIEVFRGSNATAFGSQAFMGVVNIITRPAADTPGLRMRLTQGENGIRDRQVSIAQQFGPLNVRLGMGRESDDGTRGLEDNWQKHRADLRMDWQPAATHRVEIHAGGVRFDNRAGTAGELSDPPRDQRSSSSFGQIRWHWLPDAQEELTLSYLHQSERLKDEYGVLITSAEFPQLPSWATINVGVDFGYTVERDELELEHTFSPRDDIRVVWGLGQREDKIDAPQYFYPGKAITYTSRRLFGNLEWRASDRWLINLGAMAEEDDYNSAQLSPRLGINYLLTPEHTLRVAIGRAYRQPFPFEQEGDARFYGNGVILLRQAYQPPSETLAPERLRFREIGYLAELERWRTSLDVRVFEEKLDRLTHFQSNPSPLFPPPPMDDGEAKQPIGNRKVSIHGAELALLWRPAATSWLGLNYSRIEISTNEQDIQSKPFYKNSAPRASASVLAGWAPWPNWHFSVAHHYVGAMAWYRDEDDSLPAYQRTDLRVARRLDIGTTRAELAVTISNIGAHHAEYVPWIKTGPAAYATLRLEI